MPCITEPVVCPVRTCGSHTGAKRPRLLGADRFAGEAAKQPPNFKSSSEACGLDHSIHLWEQRRAGLGTVTQQGRTSSPSRGAL